MGRKRIEIELREFEKLCAIQCTKSEIAGFFDVSEDTVERWVRRTYKAGFAEVWAAKSAGGRASLRRTQFALAEKYPAMAIFLGKNYLGQSDVIRTVEGGEGRLAELIEGLRLKNDGTDDLHAEAEGTDAALAGGEAAPDQPA